MIVSVRTVEGRPIQRPEIVPYYKLDTFLCDRMSEAILEKSRPIRLPAIATIASVTIFFFDANAKCIYCCRIMGGMGKKSTVVFEDLAGEGIKITEVEADQMIFGSYPIVQRQLVLSANE